LIAQFRRIECIEKTDARKQDEYFHGAIERMKDSWENPKKAWFVRIAGFSVPTGHRIPMTVNGTTPVLAHGLLNGKPAGNCFDLPNQDAFGY
jgi:hypothetical protein